MYPIKKSNRTIKKKKCRKHQMTILPIYFNDYFMFYFIMNMHNYGVGMLCNAVDTHSACSSLISCPLLVFRDLDTLDSACFFFKRGKILALTSRM